MWSPVRYSSGMSTLLRPGQSMNSLFRLNRKLQNTQKMQWSLTSHNLSNQTQKTAAVVRPHSHFSWGYILVLRIICGT
jgi:hypothetical protein